MPSTRASAAVCVFSIVLAVGLAPSASTAEHPADFSATETASLAAGELVTRPLERRSEGLDLIGGSSWQVIDAPSEVVWRALCDVAHYPNMVPRVVEARIVGEPGERESVYIRQGAWPVFTSYYLTLRIDARTRELRFDLDLDRPHGLKAGFGFARVVPYRTNRTLMAFGVLADVGHGILNMVARGLIHTWMLKVPWQVKRFLEHGGSNLYVADENANAKRGPEVDRP